MDHFKVCIVGAGPTGLTTVKNLVQEGITDIVCHEEQAETGGIWVYSADPKRPSVYESAHTISSKHLSSFPDFPMPLSYPDYPSNRQILDYMRSYEQHFGLSQYIRLGSRVEAVRRGEAGGWIISVTTAGRQQVHSADYLIVCSGHHRSPNMPALPGDFSGDQIHSAHYKNAKPYAGKRVLVVGGGNSACDIAAAVSRFADHVSLSIRSPQLIVPKLIAGRPVDAQYAKLRRPALRWAREWILRLGLKLFVGPYARYGLQPPGLPLLSRHPTLNTEILEQLRHGKVTARVGIDRLDGDWVRFADGTSGKYDAIIWATGFNLDAPFLKDVCPDWSEAKQLPLYCKMMLADVPDLFFIGLIQPIGCIWVLADLQARVAAAEITGKWQRPADMASLIEQQLRRDAKRYTASKRHAVQVETYEYREELMALLASQDR